MDLAAASLLDVFWSKGFEGSSVRDLCEATGQRPASLYAAFGDKDQMFLTALQRYEHWIADQLTPARDGRGGVEHVLETTYALTIADQERRGCLIINSVAERENLSTEANAAINRSFDRLRDLLGRQIAATFDSKPHQGAEAMVDLLAGATISIRLLGRAGAADHQLQNIAEAGIEAFRSWAA
jgi:TetR/AcrR family transcriptional repressor of nem operon